MSITVFTTARHG